MRYASSQRGQGIVEFALVFPVLVLIIVGIFDLGRGVYAYNTIANAAREGARIAAVNQIEMSPDCANNRPVVNPLSPHWSIKRCAADAALSLGINPADASNPIQVSYFAPPGVTWTCGSAPSWTLKVGCIARVRVNYTFRPATPILGNILGPIPMTATSEMPVERIFP